MKATYINEPGPPKNIRFADLSMPLIGPKDVLVKVNIVCVNPVDTYIRSGKVHMPMPFPFILGRDLVGEVVAVGSGVTRFSPRELVWSNNQGIHGRQGTFAEYASVNERLLYHLPPEVDERHMVAFVHSGLTAYTGLKRAAPRPGETLFVNGGSGNVGSAVIQLARDRGVRIFATAGTPEGVGWCRSLGADRAISYRGEDIKGALEEFAPDGADIYWDTSGKPDFDAVVTRLASHGRIILMSGVNTRPPFPVGPFYTRNASMLGFSITWLDDAELQEAADALNAWAASGKMNVRIDRTLPLSEAANAHRMMEDGTQLNGKIVLTV